VLKDTGLITDINIFTNQFSSNMMTITYLWCEGSTFKEISEITDMFEGKYPPFTALYNPIYYTNIFLDVILMTDVQVGL